MFTCFYLMSHMMWVTCRKPCSLSSVPCVEVYVTWGMAGGGTDKGPLLLTASLWHHYFLSIAAHGFIIVIYHYDMLPFVFTGELSVLKQSTAITVSISTLTHWCWDKMVAFFQTTFSNAFSWMKIYKFQLWFHCSVFPRVQLTIF